MTENDEQEVPFSMVDFKNDTYKVDFTPQTSLKVYVTYLDKPVSDSPFQVEVSSALDRQLSVYGPAIEEPVEVFNTTQFMIDSTRVNYSEFHFVLSSLVSFFCIYNLTIPII